MKKINPIAVSFMLTTACAIVLVGCGAINSSGDGVIREIEEGRNGVKIEVQVGNDSENTEEVFLIENTVCEVDDRLEDCADADDYLVAPTKARPGLNR